MNQVAVSQPELLALGLSWVQEQVQSACETAAQAWLSRCVDPQAARSSSLKRQPTQKAMGPMDVEAILEQSWRSLPHSERALLGQVYTPGPVAKQVLVEMGYGGLTGSQHLLDPACGGGVFLLQAAKIKRQSLLQQGLAPTAVAHTLLTTLHGIDIDEHACWLTRLFMGLLIIDILKDQGPLAYQDLPLPSVLCADALESRTQNWVEKVTGGPGPTWIAGNPPYLDAKRMPKDRRAQLKARFDGELFGSFDLYICFVHLAQKLLAPGGRIGFVLPNKVKVAHYAQKLRRGWLEKGRLRSLVDLSQLKVFVDIGVCPLIVVLGQGQGQGPASFKAAEAGSGVSLGTAPLEGVQVPYSLPGRLMQPPILFALQEPVLARLVERLLNNPRLQDVAQVRSTCSFHKKGLREVFVGPVGSFSGGLPYLGGRSYTRRNEVRPFALQWAGYEIDFDEVRLSEIGNALPPRAIFLTPKVIFCQHAKSLIAAWDPEGRYVTKDVYPVILPKDRSAQSAAVLTALCNSRLFSVLYRLFFSGLTVKDDYLHFLPSYLRCMPMPRAPLDELEALALGTKQLSEQLSTQHSEDPAAEQAASLFEALDRAVMSAYGLSASEQAQIAGLANTLGFDHQPLTRR